MKTWSNGGGGVRLISWRMHLAALLWISGLGHSSEGK